MERRTSHQALVEIPELKSNAPAPARDDVFAALSDTFEKADLFHAKLLINMLNNIYSLLFMTRLKY
jgi:hypothetical protein